MIETLSWLAVHPVFIALSIVAGIVIGLSPSPFDLPGDAPSTFTLKPARRTVGRVAVAAAASAMWAWALLDDDNIALTVDGPTGTGMTVLVLLAIATSPAGVALLVMWTVPSTALTSAEPPV